MDPAPDAHDNAAFIVRAVNSHADLVKALKDAINCVQWCRRQHKDEQSGEGIPSEAIWLGVLDQAEGRPDATTEEFLKRCIAAVGGELSKATP